MNKLSIFFMILFIGISSNVFTEDYLSLEDGSERSPKEIDYIQSLYDKLYDMVTYTPNGKLPISPKSTTFLQMIPLGLAINNDDIDDAISPSNPQGRLVTSQMFSILVDKIPAVQADWFPTIDKVTDVYEMIVEGAIGDIETNIEAEKKYQKAYDFLNDTMLVPNGADNIVINVNSPIYEIYTANKGAYSDAIRMHRTIYNSLNLSKKEDQWLWLATAPKLENAIDVSWKKWRSQGAVLVENALATMETCNNTGVMHVFDKAKRVYRDTWLPSMVQGLPSWHLSYAFPSNWCTDDNLYNELKLKYNNLDTAESSNYKKYNGGAGFSFGLWKFGGKMSKTEEMKSKHMDSKNLEITMDVCLVHINRPWMNGLIFKLNHWDLSGAKPGDISTGNLKTAIPNVTQMPLIPTAFIVVKNVRIKGDWTVEESKMISKATTGKIGLGWGPFRISGSYNSGSKDESFESTFNDAEIEIKGPQIIAWINQIVPYCPPN